MLFFENFNRRSDDDKNINAEMCKLLMFKVVVEGLKNIFVMDDCDDNWRVLSG